MISDQVPVGQRGFVSGWISAPQAIGTILGLVLVTALSLGQFLGYAAMAVLLVVLVLPFVLGMPDAVLPRELRTPLTVAAADPRASGSARASTPTSAGRCSAASWSTSATRSARPCCCTSSWFGLELGQDAEDEPDRAHADLHGVRDPRLARARPAQRPARPAQGVRVRRRGAAGASPRCCSPFVPDLTVAMVAAGLLGLGYGCFLSVDQALATQVLPDRGRPRQGPRHHEHRHRRAAGDRPAARRAHRRRTRRLHRDCSCSPRRLAIAGALAVIPIKSVR